jgi:hypothetical protein
MSLSEKLLHRPQDVGGGTAGFGDPKPGVAVPAPPIQVAISLLGPDVLLSWTGGEGPYQLQRATNLANVAWQDIGAPMNGTSVTVARDNGPAFFRVKGQ